MFIEVLLHKLNPSPVNSDVSRSATSDRIGFSKTKSALRYSSSSSHARHIENGIKKSGEKNYARKDSPSSQRTNASRWVASQLLHDITDRNELIFRRVRGILNKLTPENFDKLSYNLINIGIDKTVLKGIIILIYEKAIDEPKYCNLYAQLCLRLRNDVPNFDYPTKKSNTFLRLLLSKCQEEFETRSKASSAFDKKDGKLSPDEQIAKQIAKRKMLGNIKFIGELGKLELLQEAILHKCIQQLLAKKKRTSLFEMAEDIECMCQIMSTVGKRLDTYKATNIMKQYFERVVMLSESNELPSRIRFMLRDLLELRANKWVPRRIQAENGPRSVSQMRWEATMGQMMLPPFPFFPPGMPLPPGMQAPNMQIPPFNPGDMSSMPWFNDPILTAGGITSSMDGKMPKDYHDDNKDIFGKPVNKVQPMKQPTPVSRPTAKPDLFEPHYMKTKSGSDKTMLNGRGNDMKSSDYGNNNNNNISGTKEKEKKVIDKKNPWNVDPFMPNYTKPSINLITQNEEANRIEIQNNAPTPPPKVSPPMVPRSTAVGNAYNKPSQPTWKKCDGEVSLRPASFLTKKDEKLKKPEELPAKLQQFTNLTINDKTSSSKPKKSTLGKADAEKKIIEVYEKFKEDEDVSFACNDLRSIATNTKSTKMLAKQLLMFAVTLNENEWTEIGNIYMECIDKNIISSEIFVNTYNQLLDDIKVMERLNGKEFMATVAALLVEKGFTKVSNFIDTFQDGNHYPTAMICLSLLAKSQGKEWLLKMFEEEKVDLKLIFPVNERSDDCILKTAQEMDMKFLFPHLCLKEELLKMMSQLESDEISLIEWMKGKDSKLSRKLLVHVVVTCAVTIATKDTLAPGMDIAHKPEKELQEKEKERFGSLNTFLRTFIGNQFSDQLEAVYALQVFCFENDFPKDMLLRLFLCFYDMEIVDEDVFLKWKEDINDAYPGKGKSLFQVNNWLQWLETADEEEEDEEEGEEED